MPLDAMTGVAALPRPPTIQILRTPVVEDGLCPLPPTYRTYYVDQMKFEDQLWLGFLTDVDIILRHRRGQLLISRRCRGWNRKIDHHLCRLMGTLERLYQMEPGVLDWFHPLGVTALPRPPGVGLPDLVQRPARIHRLQGDGAGRRRE